MATYARSSSWCCYSPSDAIRPGAVPCRVHRRGIWPVFLRKAQVRRIAVGFLSGGTPATARRVGKSKVMLRAVIWLRRRARCEWHKGSSGARYRRCRCALSVVCHSRRRVRASSRLRDVCLAQVCGEESALYCPREVMRRTSLRVVFQDARHVREMRCFAVKRGSGMGVTFNTNVFVGRMMTSQPSAVMW